MKDLTVLEAELAAALADIRPGDKAEEEKALRHWDAVAGVNVTLGLPIIRASVDHGTGFGHAGDGHANELSLINAMDYGIRMANAKKDA